MSPAILQILLQVAFCLAVGVTVASLVYNIREHRSGRHQKTPLWWSTFLSAGAGIMLSTNFVFAGQLGETLEMIAVCAILIGTVTHVAVFKDFWNQNVMPQAVEKPEPERIANR